MKYLPFLSLLGFFHYSGIELLSAANTRSSPETVFIHDDKRIVSSSQINANCLIAPGNSRNSYLGIWCNGKPDNRVVWLAKTENPFDPANLSTSNLHQLCMKGSSMCEEGDLFIKRRGMKLSDLKDFTLNESLNLKKCEAECLKDSNCKAYANLNSNDGSRRCKIMWYVDPNARRNTQQDNMRADWNRKKSQKSAILFVSTISGPGILILGAACCMIWRKKWARGQESIMENLEVPLFNLSAIETATNNFSQENLIGAGGFGPVCKGSLSTGEEIAVKRLSRNSRQGTDQGS